MKTLKSADPTAEKKPSGVEPMTGGSIANEGCLVCKAAVADGKASLDAVFVVSCFFKF